MSHRVPSGSFKEHSIAERTIFRLFSDLMVLNFIVNLEIETELINSNLCLTRIVLESSGEESLGEEEPRDPEGGWCTLIEPVLEEGSSLIQINDPRSEWLEGQESNSRPFSRDLIVMEARRNSIELIGHDNFSNQRLLNVDEMVLHHDKEGVISD
jgi:hypothetical protein